MIDRTVLPLPFRLLASPIHFPRVRSLAARGDPNLTLFSFEIVSFSHCGSGARREMRTTSIQFMMTACPREPVRIKSRTSSFPTRRLSSTPSWKRDDVDFKAPEIVGRASSQLCSVPRKDECGLIKRPFWYFITVAVFRDSDKMRELPDDTTSRDRATRRESAATSRVLGVDEGYPGAKTRRDAEKKVDMAGEREGSRQTLRTARLVQGAVGVQHLQHLQCPSPTTLFVSIPVSLRATLASAATPQSNALHVARLAFGERRPCRHRHVTRW